MADDPTPISDSGSGSDSSPRRIPKVTRRAGATTRLSRAVLRVVVVIALLIGMGKVAFHFLKPVRARALARQAVEAFTRHDLERGQASLHSALKLAPNDPAVVRITARLLTAAGSAEGLAYWQRLFSLETSPEADHRAYLELALRLNRATLAGPELTRLLQAHPQEVALLHQGTRLFLRMESVETAETWARRALQLAPMQPTNQLILGEVLLLSPQSTKQSEGGRLLLPLALGRGPEQITAARLLAGVPQLGRAERSQIARALRERLPTTPDLRLLAAQFDLPTEPTARPAALDAVAREFGPDDSLRPLLANWFLERDAPAHALAVLPAERSLTNTIWLPLRLEALARTRAWTELTATLARPKLPTPPFLAQVFTGWRLADVGQTREAEASFLQAIRSATNSAGLTDPLRFIALHAQAAALPSIAVTAWIRRMDDPRLAVPSGREAARLLAGLDDERRLRDVLHRLRDLLPDDPSVAGELACVSVMLNSDLANACNQLREVRRQRPENISYRLALALGELRLGNPAAALTLAEEAPVDWATLLPRDRLAYVAVLAANQQRASARQLTAKLDPSKLKTAERALLQETLARD